jgi:hypothetical protein
MNAMTHAYRIVSPATRSEDRATHAKIVARKLAKWEKQGASRAQLLQRLNDTLDRQAIVPKGATKDAAGRLVRRLANLAERAVIVREVGKFLK